MYVGIDNKRSTAVAAIITAMARETRSSTLKRPYEYLVLYLLFDRLIAANTAPVTIISVRMW